MEQPYLIDTNVIIDYISNNFTGTAEKRLDVLFNGFFQYSIISRMEFLGYKKATIEEIRDFGGFLDTGEQFIVDMPVSDKVIEISRIITKKNLPDLIIAATALVNNCTLLTRNIADFKNIPGLIVENPHDWV